MTTTHRTVLWSCAAGAGLLLIGASFYLGLDKADKVSSITSGLLGIATFALSIYQLIETRRGNDSQAPNQTQRGGNNSTNIQSGGNLTIGDNNKIGDSR